MVNVIGLPTQVPIVGITEIVPEIGDVPVFVAVKAGILPIPFAPNPIAALLFVQP